MAGRPERRSNLQHLDTLVGVGLVALAAVVVVAVVSVIIGTILFVLRVVVVVLVIAAGLALWSRLTRSRRST